MTIMSFTKLFQEKEENFNKSILLLLYKQKKNPFIIDFFSFYNNCSKA